MPKKKEKEKTRGNIILFLRHFGPRRNNLPPRTVVPKNSVLRAGLTEDQIYVEK